MSAGIFATSQDVSLPPIPELLDPHFVDILLPLKPQASQPAQAKPANFIAALKAQDNRRLTNNLSPAYKSSESALLDAFYQLVPYASDNEIYGLLERAWKEGPETALKIIWHLRSIPDGKSEKENFYVAFGWLYCHHPRTAIMSLPQLVRKVCTRTPKTTEEGSREPPRLTHGTYKDLVNILCLVVSGDIDPAHPRASKQFGFGKKLEFLHAPREPPSWMKERWADAREGWPDVEETKLDNRAKAEAARARRFVRRQQTHARLTDRLEKDGKFRALYIAVARIFAESLKEDLDVLRKTKVTGLTKDERGDLSRAFTHAPKYFPSDGASHDLLTNMSTAIAVLLFSERAHPYEHAPGFVERFEAAVDPSKGISTDVAHALRNFTRRHMISSLREEMQLVERLTSLNRWREVNYSRVPSICMSKTFPHFLVHDQDRFVEHLVAVQEGKKSISGATLPPHEIIASALRGGVTGGKKGQEKMPDEARELLEKVTRDVVEGQWGALVRRMRESGQLGNAIAVCDVSGSMGSIHRLGRSRAPPILVAVSFSLLLAQLASPPFANHFITFSSHPELVELDPSETIVDQVERMTGSSWGMNTDFQKVFGLILSAAKNARLAPEDMVKRVFVFSDMEFDDCRRSDHDWRTGQPAGSELWETDHDRIKESFADAGYEVPTIVYWNLASASAPLPVLKSEKGVALMSGWGPGALKVFMDGAQEGERLVAGDKGEEDFEVVSSEEDNESEAGEEIDPMSVLEKAAGMASFSGLEVFD
jgi:hypothetical protein